ncbi:MAG: tetratricopeptide repeat protein [Alphaproteobacteria bacterium]
MTGREKPPEDSAALLRRATELHGAGDAAGAAALFRQIASAHPDQPAAWALLGGALLDAGQAEEAVDALGRAAALAPDNDDIAIELAVASHASGRPEAAVGVLSGRLARLQESERAQAVRAEAYRSLSRLDAAIAGYRRVLEINPDNNAARVALGACQQRAGDLAGAVQSYREALARDPLADDAWSNLGLALKAAGRFDDAVTALENAVALNPDDPATLCNLGVVLMDAGRMDDAARALESVTGNHPAFVGGWSNLGNLRQEEGRLDAALEAHGRALALDPDNAECHWNRAMTLLLSGDFTSGFAEYEWRRHTPDHAPPVHDSPLWDGSDPSGRRILLLAEQGFGDAIQFARYAPVLRELGADVTIGCHAKLAGLFGTLPGSPRIVSTGGAVPPVDCHAPLMSLPHLLGSGTETIPANVPYLFPPIDAKPPPAGNGRRRIGLCWTGNPKHPDNAQRSVTPAALSPLLARDDVEWISLQFGPGSEQAAGTCLADWSAHLDGFADTAAALSALDLVITVDTATAHLAGALGRPVWLLLKYSPDWRWMLARADSPWYPTMRLFRQDAPGDWADVVHRLGEALEMWVEN